MAKVTSAQSCKDPIKLIGLVTAACKDMFLVCFSKTDKNTKHRALPLLQKVNHLEIASAIFEQVISSGSMRKSLDGAGLAKLQTQTARIQDDLANVKAKMACNENTVVKEEFQQFCDAVGDVEELLQSVDKRLESGMTYLNF